MILKDMTSQAYRKHSVQYQEFLLLESEIKEYTNIIHFYPYWFKFTISMNAGDIETIL